MVADSVFLFGKETFQILDVKVPIRQQSGIISNLVALGLQFRKHVVQQCGLSAQNWLGRFHLSLFVIYSPLMSHQREQSSSSAAESRRCQAEAHLHPLDVVFGFLLDEVDAF